MEYRVIRMTPKNVIVGALGDPTSEPWPVPGVFQFLAFYLLGLHPVTLTNQSSVFQSWTGPEKLLALDELIDSCEPTQVKHMMQVIEPQFQRDFISLLPKEVGPYIYECGILYLGFYIIIACTSYVASHLLRGHVNHKNKCNLWY